MPHEKKPEDSRPYIDLTQLRRDADRDKTSSAAAGHTEQETPPGVPAEVGHAVVIQPPRSGKTTIRHGMEWWPEQDADTGGDTGPDGDPPRRRWPWKRHAAADGAQPRKPRRWKLRVAVALLVLLIGWIVYEQITMNSGDGYAPSTSAGATAEPDPDSVKVAVRSHELILSGKVKQGCALYVDSKRCGWSWSGDERTFLEKPHATKSAGMSEAGGHPAATVTIVQFRHTTAPDDTQQWAVLVRNTDHKVIGAESLGSSKSGMSLVQVGQQIREEV